MRELSGVYRARPGQVAYGYPIGMLCAQWNIPFVPGDLNNATTFDFPMRYLEVPGVTGSEVLRGDGGNFTAKLIDAARTLEAEGVRAITGNCGFMAVCQQEVAAAVHVPVFLSSLLQIPMVSAMLGGNRKLGLLTANSAAITPAILAGAGVVDTSRLVVQGLQDYDHFHDVIIKESGVLDLARLTSEVARGAQELVTREPDVGALLVECSDLPVYSRAIREATGLPVFDWASFINYVHRAVVPKEFNGIF